jgi:hypothetical protein
MAIRLKTHQAYAQECPVKVQAKALAAFRPADLRVAAVVGAEHHLEQTLQNMVLVLPTPMPTQHRANYEGSYSPLFSPFLA